MSDFKKNMLKRAQFQLAIKGIIKYQNIFNYAKHFSEEITYNNSPSSNFVNRINNKERGNSSKVNKYSISNQRNFRFLNRKNKVKTRVNIFHDSLCLSKNQNVFGLQIKNSKDNSKIDISKNERKDESKIDSKHHSNYYRLSLKIPFVKSYNNDEILGKIDNLYPIKKQNHLEYDKSQTISKKNSIFNNDNNALRESSKPEEINTFYKSINFSNSFINVSEFLPQNPRKYNVTISKNNSKKKLISRIPIRKQKSFKLNSDHINLSDIPEKITGIKGTKEHRILSNFQCTKLQERKTLFHNKRINIPFRNLNLDKIQFIKQKKNILDPYKKNDIKPTIKAYQKIKEKFIKSNSIIFSNLEKSNQLLNDISYKRENDSNLHQKKRFLVIQGNKEMMI